MANRGLMAEHNFIGKTALLGWLNTTLNLKLERVEDTCTGAVACQLMDCLHPGSVNMKKVDFNVKNDYEFVNNYKELQQAFNKVGVNRAFNVNQLSKGKPQDNNEFMQWFKGYWDSVSCGQDLSATYNAVARRQLSKTGDWKKMSLGEGGYQRSADNIDATIPAVRPAGSKTSVGRSIVANKINPNQSQGTKKALKTDVQVNAGAIEELKLRVNELTDQVTDLKLKVDVAERERDFYFDKLRDIEILCQAPELADIQILKTVEKILYAADSEEAKVAMLEAQEAFGARLVEVENAAVETEMAAMSMQEQC